ncbi:MAG: hypothetical protein KatS3mg105_2308 [Gemmatales bacterium]|nr:MAG: hypothetical protein KatS3mg105_2308 [Gemmatales bacterium]
MKQRLRRFWPFIKAFLAAAILFAIGRRFWLDLRQHPEIWDVSLRPGPLILAALSFVAGMTFFALYWIRLLKRLGQHPQFLPAMRAYFVGQLGKYLPGKAWALLMRTTLGSGPGVRLGLAAATTFYEVLATMSSGALVAAVVFFLFAPAHSTISDAEIWQSLVRLEASPNLILGRRVLVALAFLFLAPVGLPIIPPVFNRLVDRLSLPFRDKDADPFPQFTMSMLLEGLGITLFGWILFGLSTKWTIEALQFGNVSWDWKQSALLMGFVALSYVAGFVIIVVPGGLGIREFLLTIFFVPHFSQTMGIEEARGAAILTALVLRLIWTVSEVVIAGATYLFPAQNFDASP